MEIQVTDVKNAVLLVDNLSIEGKILNIDKNGGKITFELKPGSPFSTAEMGKKGEVLFEYTGHKYFISGKTFFQPPSRVLITPDTDAEIEKRSEKRIETPSIPGTISYTSGVFHKKHVIKCTVINLCMKGARVETLEPLGKDIAYDISIALPYHHATIDFYAPLLVKNCRHYRNIFNHGVSFPSLDDESVRNLKKYLYGDRRAF